MSKVFEFSADLILRILMAVTSLRGIWKRQDFYHIGKIVL